MEDKIPFWLRVWQRLHIDFWLFIGLVTITAYGMLVLYTGDAWIYGHADYCAISA